MQFIFYWNYDVIISMCEIGISFAKICGDDLVRAFLRTSFFGFSRLVERWLANIFVIALKEHMMFKG